MRTNKKYNVNLTPKQRRRLKHYMRFGSVSPAYGVDAISPLLSVQQAQVLLAVDGSGRLRLKDKDVAEAYTISTQTVHRTRERFVVGGLGGIQDGRLRYEDAYTLQLSASEREQLEKLIASGKAVKHQLSHAKILLALDRGGRKAGIMPPPSIRMEHVATDFGVTRRTVQYLCARYRKQGLSGAVFAARYRPPTIAA